MKTKVVGFITLLVLFAALTLGVRATDSDRIEVGSGIGSLWIDAYSYGSTMWADPYVVIRVFQDNELIVAGDVVGGNYDVYYVADGVSCIEGDGYNWALLSFSEGSGTISIEVSVFEANFNYQYDSISGGNNDGQFGVNWY